MPYINKDGKPILWEETDYWNQYRKALIYYPVKAKRKTSCDLTYEVVIDPSPTPTITPTNTPTNTPTPTVTPTMTPTPSGISFDSDAAAYLADVITSGGTTNATISAATDTLFTSLKNNGLYSKMLVMYPFIGGVAASHAINALLNKTYDITWFGGMSHGISGSTGNGTNAYGLLNFLNTDTIQNNYSLGFYQFTENTPIKSEEIIMGQSLLNVVNYPDLQIATRLSPNSYFMRSGNTSSASGANGGNQDGLYVLNRTGSTTSQLFRNGNNQILQVSGSYTEGSGYTLAIFNFYGNTGVYGNGYANQGLNFVFVAQGFTSTDLTNFSTIINTFQTSLGRNTY